MPSNQALKLTDWVGCKLKFISAAFRCIGTEGGQAIEVATRYHVLQYEAAGC